MDGKNIKVVASCKIWKHYQEKPCHRKPSEKWDDVAINAILQYFRKKLGGKSFDLMSIDDNNIADFCGVTKDGEGFSFKAWNNVTSYSIECIMGIGILSQLIPEEYAEIRYKMKYEGTLAVVDYYYYDSWNVSFILFPDPNKGGSEHDF